MAAEAGALQSVFVQFDERQVEVRTNVGEIAEFVRESHSAMVVDNAPHCIGNVVITRDAGRYFVDEVRVKARGKPTMLFDRLKRRILELFIRDRPDLLWIHAAVVSRDGGSLIVVAPSGQGKSTLAMLLAQSGWKYLSDEAAPIDIETMCVIPYPRSPVRRLHPGRTLESNELGEIETETWAVPDHALQRDRSRVRSVIFPRFSPDVEPEFRKATSGEASVELIRNIINFHDHSGVAVAAAARFALDLPCYTLIYNDGANAARLLHDITGEMLE